MVAARRGVEGHVPLSALSRLAGVLFDDEGEVHFRLDFDRDALGVAYLELAAQTSLPLQCQRSLQRFEFQVALQQRLGLIRAEADEAGLPAGYEPLLVPPDGHVRALDVVEDELILALPVVPVDPDRAPAELEWPPASAAAEPHQATAHASPFAVLATLKQKT